MDEQPTNLPAVERFGGILAQVGGAVVGFSTLAYFVGWNEASSYYYALGAPWVVISLSATRLLLESAILITGLGVITLFSVLSLSERMWQLKHAFRVSNASAFFGGVLTLTATLLSRWVTPSAIFWLSQSAVVLFTLSTAITVAEVVMSVRMEGLKWFNRALWYVVPLLMLGLWQAPYLAGTARAARDGNPTLSALPEIFSESKNDGGWLLVAPIDGKFLLMKPDPRREKRKFRVVDNLGGWTIGPAR
jgi:hypothetical protein